MIDMRKTHADKIREAVTELGLASPKEIMDWIKKHYSDDPVNPHSYRADIIGCSVNHSSSHHYPSMPKFLYYEKNLRKYRLYNPEKDGKEHETLETLEEEIPYSKISTTGQLYLPSSIQRELNVKPGDIIVFQKNDKGEITLKKGKLKIEVE
ncbi:MAG: AbrB/MazE/SpoVT family DNA-binding domain-containing protein [Candidatus Bathyarchaeia archaeon]